MILGEKPDDYTASQWLLRDGDRRDVAAARLGAIALGLNVAGSNTAARALYESLGYEITALQMRLPLAGP